MLFVCVANSGRSVMAERLFRGLAYQFVRGEQTRPAGVPEAEAVEEAA